MGRLSKLKYKGKMHSRIALFSMPECKSSPREFSEAIAAGKTVKEAFVKPERKNKKKLGRISGSKNVIKSTVLTSVLPVYSKEEKLAIMLIPVNPKKSRYHNFGVKNNPLDNVRRRTRIR